MISIIDFLIPVIFLMMFSMAVVLFPLAFFLLLVAFWQWAKEGFR